MSRAQDETSELLDRLLQRGPDAQPPTLEELESALERIEELSKQAMDDDEVYLDAAAETILELRAKLLTRQPRA
jgi:streptomycin 6-kinase